MQRIDLNQNWEYVEAALQNPLLVNMLEGWQKTDLPHDFSIEKGRDPKSAAGLDEGFFDGAGLYYKKTFVLEPAAAGKQVWLEFEGVSGFCEVWVNKQFVAKHGNPYTSFWVEITEQLHSGENEITLHADSRMKPNSRWYVGAGLYRRVWLHIGDQAAAVKPHGLRFATKELTEEKAVVSVSAELTAPAAVRYELIDTDGAVVASGEGPELTVPAPRAWAPGSPYLYTLRAIAGEDITEEKVGIRTLTVNSRNGLLLNGKPIKLKGGCIHHDLGILGAADHIAAERRRIRLLQESGYNAVRLAHNPFGPAIFEACDELGMLAVEEAFDEWVLGRTSFGLHITFEDRWERDLADMITRDYNHPCIIMWGTGNEVEERDGSADGFAWAARLAGKVKELDATRPVTASACALFSEYGQRPADGTTGNQALNMAFDNFASGNDIWGDTTAPYFAPLDVAGYNYKSVRYAHDREKFPDRVIYGSESYPRAAYQTWMDTLANPNVIGDFVWTAWDYLGEVGVGRWEVSDQERPGNPAWPWMTAACSDIDFIGQKRPQSFYRDTFWQESRTPQIFCLPPELTGKNIARLSWGWLPVERNYTYPGCEGQALEVHVYANADEVELLQNEVSLGRRACGAAQEYQTVFQVDYQPGCLVAVAYREGRECGRSCLSTSGPTARLHLLADRPVIAADGQDLCFVTIKAVDERGLPVYLEDGSINVTVQGGRLLALGNANPKPDRLHPFTEAACPLYHGMALAVIRSEEGGKGCLVTAQLKNLPADSLGIGFAPVQPTAQPYISETSAGPLDLPLGELLANEKVLAVLKDQMGYLLENPMLNAMKSMSLKKLLGMGGMAAPAGLADALTEAMG